MARRLRLVPRRLRPVLFPRRFHAYCVGSVKSGTHSLRAILKRHYRTHHEPDAENFIAFLAEVAGGRHDATDTAQYLRERDERLWLELDSAHLNALAVEPLVRLFPDARFILTLRDCYSWLDSWLNHELSRPPPSERWQVWRELAFTSAGSQRPPEEKPLEELGLSPLAGYLSCWSRHNQHVLESVPAERLLIVRTSQIQTRTAELADFLKIPIETIEPKLGHAFRAITEHGLLGLLPDGYLDQLVREHCGALMERHFPGVRGLVPGQTG